MSFPNKKAANKKETQAAKNSLDVRQAKKILALTKNKTRPISFVLNPDLWDKFKALAKKQGQSASGLLEDMMITQLIEYHMLED